MAMIQCPRCGSGAPDSATECKICGSPLGAAADAAPAQPAPTAAAATSVPNLPGVPGTPDGGYLSGTGGGGEVRVSLTGEVMEIPKPTPRGAGPGGFGPPPGATPAGGKAGPAGPPRPRGAGLAYDEAPKKSSPVGPIIAVILLLGGGIGGWWYYNNRTNPKDQAVLAYTAFIKDQDYKKLYTVVALSEEEKKKYTDAETFEKEFTTVLSTNQMAKAGMEMLKNSISDISSGEPAYSGGKADVPTSAKLSFNGNTVTMKGTAHMIKEGGIWKLDWTAGGEAAGQKSITDLMGKPDGAPVPSGDSAGGGGMPGMK